MNEFLSEKVVSGTESQKSDMRQIFELQRVYIKEINVQFAEQTETFLLKWEPKVNFELKTENKELNEKNYYETSVNSTIKIDIANKEIGSIKVVQAGIFLIEGFDEETRKMVLNGHCPDLLYPYLCSQIAHITADAGFPSLQMRPMSFIALYHQNLQEVKSATKDSDSIIVN